MWIELLRGGDRRALTDIFQRSRERLRPMVELRMDARLQGRARQCKKKCFEQKLAKVTKREGKPQTGGEKAGKSQDLCLVALHRASRFRWMLSGHLQDAEQVAERAAIQVQCRRSGMTDDRPLLGRLVNGKVNALLC
jgi:hypothetical protein